MISEVFEKFKEAKCDKCTKDRECSIHPTTDFKGKYGARCGDVEYIAGGGNNGE